METQIGNGIKDFISFLFRISIYKRFIEDSKKRNLHISVIEIDENQLKRETLLENFYKKCQR